MGKFTPVEADFRAAARHIQYEIDSYIWAWKTYQETARDDKIRRRLIAESMLLHFRNLLNFFSPQNPKDTDVLAAHFVPDAADLTEATLPLERYRQRLNLLLSHLSYRRADYVRADDMAWPADRMTDELSRAWRAFIGSLSDERRSWFVSEHSGEIEIATSPLVTVENPFEKLLCFPRIESSPFTTTTIETEIVVVPGAANARSNMTADLKRFCDHDMRAKDRYQPWIILALMNNGGSVGLDRLSSEYEECERALHLPKRNANARKRLRSAIDVLNGHRVADTEHEVVRLIAHFVEGDRAEIETACHRALNSIGLPPPRFVSGGLPSHGKRR